MKIDKTYRVLLTPGEYKKINEFTDFLQTIQDELDATDAEELGYYLGEASQSLCEFLDAPEVEIDNSGDA